MIDGNAGSGTSYTDRSVSAQGSYVYRVKAVSPTGVSQWSAYAKADTPAAPEPTPTPTPTPEPNPADLAPSGLEVNLVENRVTLTWEAPASDAGSVTGYEVLRRRPKEGENAPQTLVADTGSAAAIYVDATANEPGVRYTYRVKALRGSDVSQWSNFAFINLDQDYTPPASSEGETIVFVDEEPALPQVVTKPVSTDLAVLTITSERSLREHTTQFRAKEEIWAAKVKITGANPRYGDFTYFRNIQDNKPNDKTFTYGNPPVEYTIKRIAYSSGFFSLSSWNWTRCRRRPYETNGSSL